MLRKTLHAKLKNTPTDTPLVCSSVTLPLNKEETLSVVEKVRTCNNPEVDLPQREEDQNLRVSGNVHVFVLNKRNESLMPTSPRKARLLLENGKAIVVKRFPFTIKLIYQTGENKQNVCLGIDSGYSNIGFSLITEKDELISGETKLDNFTSKRLTEKRMYRRNRRNKLRYREPRFNNRKTEKGWLPPSIERRYQTHINLINKIKQLTPINKIRIEVGNFDIQKLINPEISGDEYQQGSLYDYSNLKAFALCREKNICQLCNKEIKTKSNLHHIIPKSQGGTDKPDNIALLHEFCHKKLHKQGLYKKLKKNKQYKESTFMNIIKNRFKKDLDCELCFGYETFTKRKELRIEKSHSNDAFVISGGTTQTRSFEYLVEQKRKNNRSLQLNRKGFKPSIRKKRYKLQPKDLIKYKGKVYEIDGSHNLGTRAIFKDRNNKKISLGLNKINWFFNVKTLNFKERSCVNFSRR